MIIAQSLQSQLKETIKRFIKMCWARDPEDRPTLAELYVLLTKDEWFFDGVDAQQVLM